MVLDPKHLDEMDDFSEFDEKIDASDSDLAEAGPNHPLSWRRVIIERAVNNVKKALENKADTSGVHKTGDLVFDKDANKFGRVIESKPGFLNLSLLAGGKLVKRDVNQKDFVRENRQKLTLSEMATKLYLSEVEIIGLLNQLELETDKNVKPKLVGKQKTKKKAELSLEKVKKKPEIKMALQKEIQKTKKLSPAKVINKKKPLAKKPVPKDTAVSFAKLLPKGATTDPVRDPNGYIQQNFLLMSNRELSVATGLSEHTIRRKLGEWNLKRKDFINKA